MNSTDRDREPHRKKDLSEGEFMHVDTFLLNNSSQLGLYIPKPMYSWCGRVGGRMTCKGLSLPRLVEGRPMQPVGRASCLVVGIHY